MEADQILKLFDSYWSEQQILTLKHNSPAPAAKLLNKVEESRSYTVPNLRVRSLSDRCLGVNPSNFSENEADKQLLNARPTLHKILSGKELLEFSKEAVEAQMIEKSPRKKSLGKRRKGEIRRSLSALEFEEVKGFMDLGFVFTEEDKSSSLVSIIPGLQKLGKNGEAVKEKAAQVSRPYLSESWGALKQGKMDNKPDTMNWSVQSVYSEINMKDKLRVWAQTVASTVR